MSREKKILIRLSAKEYQHLKTHAENSNLYKRKKNNEVCIATYCRDILLKKYYEEKEAEKDLKKLINYYLKNYHNKNKGQLLCSKLKDISLKIRNIAGHYISSVGFSSHAKHYFQGENIIKFYAWLYLIALNDIWFKNVLEKGGVITLDEILTAIDYFYGFKFTAQFFPLDELEND